MTGLSAAQSENPGGNADADDELPYGIVIIDWLETSPDDTTPPATRLYVESLEPIDIEVFEREVYYYEFLSSNESSNSNITTP